MNDGVTNWRATGGRVLNIFWLMTCMLFVCGEICAEVKVSRARIASGFSMRLQRYSWGQFECEVENTDNVKREVMLRVVSSGGPSQLNVFSGMVEVPSKTRLAFKAPVFVENSEVYDLEVFVNGNKQASTRENEHNVKLLNQREVQLAILNDSDDSLGAFMQLPEFKGNLFASMFSFRTLPDVRMAYDAFKALLILKPDFSKYTADQFKAILEYAAQGGLVIFADPQGALDAAGTPLEDLLPVIPLSVEKTADIPGFKTMFPAFKGFGGNDIALLNSLPKKNGTNLLAQGELPLLRVMPYGLGTVRISAFAPSQELFNGDSATWTDYLKTVFSRPNIIPDQEKFTEPLDKLTGFPVPSVGAIRNLILFYFIVLIVVLGVAVVLKKTVLGWLGASLAALLMTGYVLHRANQSLGQRGSVLASIRLENKSEGAPQNETYASYFAAESVNLDIGAPNRRDLFSTVPPSAKGGMIPGFAFQTQMVPDDDATTVPRFGAPKQSSSGAFRRISPIELRRMPDGSFNIKDLNVAARTSKQFLLSGSTEKKAGSSSITWERPRLKLGMDGFELQPWKSPEGIDAESAFLILPGGSKLLKKESGEYTIDKKQGLFVDPLAADIRESLECGFAKNTPYVALVVPLHESGIAIEPSHSVQGKRIVIVPAELEIGSMNVLLPEEGIVLSAADSSSRMMFSGNRVSQKYPTQTGFSVSLSFDLPPYLLNLVAEKLTLRLAYSHSGNIKLVPSLRVNDGKDAKKYMKGREVARNVYEFTGPELRNVISQLTGTGELRLESMETAGVTGEDQGFRVASWTLQDIGVSVKGTLPGAQIPLKY